MQQSWQKYQIQYEKCRGGRTRRKSFQSETDALVWVEVTRPYYWRMDAHIQVYLKEGGQALIVEGEVETE